MGRREKASLLQDSEPSAFGEASNGLPGEKLAQRSGIYRSLDAQLPEEPSVDGLVLRLVSFEHPESIGVPSGHSNFDPHIYGITWGRRAIEDSTCRAETLRWAAVAAIAIFLTGISLRAVPLFLLKIAA